MDIDSRWINTGSYYTVKVHNLYNNYNNVMAVLRKCDDLSQFQYFFIFFLTAISHGEGDGAYLSCIRAKEGYTTVGLSWEMPCSLYPGSALKVCWNLPLPAHLRTVPVWWWKTQLLLPKIPDMLIPGLMGGDPWKLISSSGTLWLVQ